jgi:hypothetical protein
LLHGQRIVGHGLDALDDAPTVRGLERHHLQDEQIERALDQRVVGAHDILLTIWRFSR